MPKYSDDRKLIWYDDIPCPACGADRISSWDKRVSRALQYKAIVCECCIAKEYGLTVEELRNIMLTVFGLVPCPGI